MARGKTEARYGLYRRQTDALIRLCNTRVLRRERKIQPGPESGPRQEWGNFHSRETWQGRTFRWSEPLAGWLLHLEAGPWKLRIDTGGLATAERLGEALFTWNGNKTCPKLSGDGKLEFTLLQTGRRAGVFCLAVLPLDLAHTGETRELGLPVFSLSLARAEPGSQDG
jgi:hypothetical protein